MKKKTRYLQFAAKKKIMFVSVTFVTDFVYYVPVLTHLQLVS